MAVGTRVRPDDVMSAPGFAGATGSRGEAFRQAYGRLVNLITAGIPTATGKSVGTSQIAGIREIPSIVGVGYGYLSSTDRRGALVVLVDDALSRSDHVPVAELVQAVIGDVSFRVQQCGAATALAFTSPFRPLLGGVSVGPDHPDGGTGTFGCHVNTRGKPSRRLFLSNYHVLVPPGIRPNSDGSFNEPHVPILQPGRGDLGEFPRDHIGWLRRAYPIDFSGLNEVDAALGELLPGPTLKRRRKILKRAQSERNKSEFLQVSLPHTYVQVGTIVEKSGRSTEHTYGVVTVERITIRVSLPGHGSAMFVNQIGISDGEEEFSRDGDSGSLIVTQKSRAPIGLLFARSAGQAPMTYANPIGAVLDGLSIRLEVS